MTTSKLRRKRILKACNPDIQDLAEEENLFEEAGPHLFGDKFETKMKERAESVKILSKSQQGQGHRKFFEGAATLMPRGWWPLHKGRQVPYQGYNNPFGGYRGGYSYSQAAQASFKKKQNK